MEQHTEGRVPVVGHDRRANFGNIQSVGKLMAIANGYILYEGPSMINGAPIVAIVTGTTRKSKNAKTGNMLQTWILSAAEVPTEAVKSGSDKAVCGGCRFRPKLRGGCYVNVGQAPQRVFAAWKRGNYPKLPGAHVVAGRMLRLGAYGDPTAVPLAVWTPLVEAAAGHTGYTHQWRAKKFQGFSDMLQASVDMPEDLAPAIELGWGTFRVRLVEESGLNLPGEIDCPFYARKINCHDCGLCDGARGNNIAVDAHGASAKRHTRK